MTFKIEREECNLIYIKSIKYVIKIKLRQNNDFKF